MPTIVLSALKGGVGKTTTAIGLSAAATAAGHQSWIIDVDEQGGALDWAELAASSGQDCPEVRPAHALGEQLDPNAWIIIDTPPAASATRHVRRALEAADLVMVPLGSSPADVLRVGPSIELIEQHSNAPIVLLLTRVRAQTRSPGDTRDRLSELDYHVLETTIPLREAIYQALGTSPPPVMTDFYHEVLTEIAPMITTEALL